MTYWTASVYWTDEVLKRLIVNTHEKMIQGGEPSSEHCFGPRPLHLILEGSAHMSAFPVDFSLDWLPSTVSW